jgi:hypothetical protein
LCGLNRGNPDRGLLAVPAQVATNADFGYSNDCSQFGFDISGGADQTLVVLGSTNLLDWAPAIRSRPTSREREVKAS